MRRFCGSIPYMAAFWAALFALPSFYWAFGGSVGIGTIAAEPDQIPLLNEPIIVFATGIAKVLGGGLAVAVALNWCGTVVTRWFRVLAVIGGGFMLLYGGALAIQHGLMVAEAVDTPDLLGARAARWHLGLWDQVWMLGGVLFLITGMRRPPE